MKKEEMKEMICYVEWNWHQALYNYVWDIMDGGWESLNEIYNQMVIEMKLTTKEEKRYLEYIVSTIISDETKKMIEKN